jgi:hypothetical protein
MLEGRLSGPALTIRTSEYTQFVGTNGEKPLTVVSTKLRSAVLPQLDTWPRTFLVATTQADVTAPPSILIFHQPTARDPYTLWGWAQSHVGTVPRNQILPLTAEYAEGSRVLSDTDQSLKVLPADVLGQYADVLTNGDQSEFAATFVSDDLRAWVQEQRDRSAQEAGDVVTVTMAFAAAGGPLAVFETVDKGALVVGELTGTVTTEAVPGGKVNAQPFEEALAGAPVTDKLVVTRTIVVVLYVPEKSALGQDGEPMQVVGVASQNSITAAAGE